LVGWWIDFSFPFLSLVSASFVVVVVVILKDNEKYTPYFITYHCNSVEILSWWLHSRSSSSHFVVVVVICAAAAVTNNRSRSNHRKYKRCCRCY
jgi:hypothetical protein